MTRFKFMFVTLLILLMCGGLLITVVHAEDLGSSKKIVMFHEKVTWGEIKAYAQEWQSAGVSVVMELPFINALVLSVPTDISSAELAADPRVATVEDNQPVQIQAVNAAADGGAGDGGAGDGGAGDGGAGDGGAGDGGAGDGGAGDGGAGDGGAGDGGAGDGGAVNSSPSWSFIKPIFEPSEHHRPWGVLKLYGQLRDPGLLTDELDPNGVPMVIRIALREMTRKKTRKKIRVAILDTGVDFTHPSLAGKIKGGFDFITLTPGLPQDDNGHGTHIAGTLCARLEDDPFGLAPPIELYSVKILDKYAMGNLDNIILGLTWALDNKIDVVNMSIGYREDSPAVRLAIKKAYEAGLIMVAAAGNHSNWDDPSPVAAGDGGAGDGGAGDGGAGDGGAGDGGAGDGGAGDGGAGDGGAGDGGAGDGGAGDGSAASDQQSELPWYSVMYPARYSEVIAVGASNSFGEMTKFTNYSAELDLTAPGTNIVSTNVWSWGGFGVCSGTSMATPHVTGAVAMMLALDSQLSAQEVASILKHTSEQGDLNLIGALKKVWKRAFRKARRIKEKKIRLGR